ncbi:MAG: shikimate kinase [Eubacteriales bacterium]|nr:shikimate kinase [Eubacteriales bacterium]
MKKTKLFLIGFMGCGKSTIASGMQSKFQMNRIEMDQTIESLQQKSISQIFRDEGEDYFRKLETDLLKSFRTRKNLIVSCGGGVPMREENVREMKEQGVIVWLTAAPSTILKRVRNNHDRPLLEGHMTEEYIQDMMEKREPAYRDAADLVISTDGKSPLEIGNEIMKEFRHITGR